MPIGTRTHSVALVALVRREGQGESESVHTGTGTTIDTVAHAWAGTSHAFTSSSSSPDYYVRVSDKGPTPSAPEAESELAAGNDEQPGAD